MIEFRTLYENEIEKWFDFVTNEIFIDAPQDYFPTQWYCDEYRDINNIFVAVDEYGAILSTIRVFFRELYINGTSVLSGGIGSVGTKETHRGIGLSTKLFEMCQEYMEFKGVKISYLLCGEHNEKFYNRFSYRRIPFVRKVSKIGKSILIDKDFTIRDAVFPHDISTLSRMYNAFSGKYNGPVVRSTVYWEKWVPSFKGEKFFVAIDRNMNPMSYINVSLENSRLFVYDFGYMEGYADIFDSLISSVAEQFGANDLQVKYPSVIRSNMKVIDQDERLCVMLKLINAFSINDIHVENTHVLLTMLQGDSCQSKLLFWRVDDI